MDIQANIEHLTRSAAAIRALVENIVDAYARWRPAEGRWSIVEIVCHLADEEREDFRMRFALTLSDPGAEWPSIDPAGVVTTRDYNSRQIESALADFLSERSLSIAWLKSLTDPDLSIVHIHPRFGSMSAGDLLSSWVAHDLLHIRQIARIMHERVAHDASPFSVEYAGPLAT